MFPILRVSRLSIEAYINLAQQSIVVSEIVMNRIPERLHDCVLDVLQTPKSNASQKRAVLQKKGLQKALIDELECLYEDCK